jgi:hypothetical protein
MLKSPWLALLLVPLAIGGVIAPAITPPALAQSSTCPPRQNFDMREQNLRDQARAALDNGNIADATQLLQAALALTPQTQYPHQTIEQWLLEDNNGTRFAQLLQLGDRTQTTPMLKQLWQITQRLGPNDNTIKMRALTAIAQHYITLDQISTAKIVLDQARNSVRSIKDVIARADSLIDIAAGYATFSRSQVTLTSLAEAKQTLQQAPPTERLSRFVRLVKLYANLGDPAMARAIANQIPQTSEHYSVALREIATAYLARRKLDDAERLIPAIAHPVQKAMALSKLAVAYEQAQQSSLATQRFATAIAIAKNPKIESAFVPSGMPLKDIILDLVEVGRRDQARLLLSQVTVYRRAAYKAILFADLQAKEPLKARAILSQQLTLIQTQPDSWQSYEMADLIKTATDAEQFDWFLQEWERIAKIGYASSDESLEKIAQAYARKGRHLQALQWAEKLPRANYPLTQIRLKSAIALIAHQSGQTTWARTLLQTTENQVTALSQAARDRLQREGGEVNEPDEIEYIGVGIIALAYAQMGDATMTTQLLDRVIKSKSNQNDLQLGGRVDNPFELFQAANQLAGAFQLAQGSVLPAKRQQRLQSLVALTLAKNRFDLATAILAEMVGSVPQTQVLLAIAQRHTELKQSDKALPLLARAFKLAQTIPGDESQFDRLGAEGGTVIEVDYDRGSLIEAIAIQYAQLQQPTQALNVANTLQEKKTRDQALDRIRCAGR